jgi:hypothetical protein
MTARATVVVSSVVEPEGETIPKLGAGLTVTGPTIRAFHQGQWKQMVDGNGLFSPGRWPPSRRTADSSDQGKNILGVLRRLAAASLDTK